jgi:hypothetical protein
MARLSILWDELDDESAAKLDAAKDTTNQTLTEIFHLAQIGRVIFMREPNTEAGVRSWGKFISNTAPNCTFAYRDALDDSTIYSVTRSTCSPTPLSVIVSKSPVDLYRESIQTISSNVTITDTGAFRHEIQDACHGAKTIHICDRYLLRLVESEIRRKSYSNHGYWSLGVIVEALMNMPEENRPKAVSIFSEVLQPCDEYLREQGKKESKEAHQDWETYILKCKAIAYKAWTQCHQKLKKEYDFSFKLLLNNCITKEGGRIAHDRYLYANKQFWISSAGFKVCNCCCKAKNKGINPTTMARVDKPKNILPKYDDMTEALYR